MHRRSMHMMALAAVLAVTGAAWAEAGGKGPTTRPAAKTAPSDEKKPTSDLEYWLNQAEPVKKDQPSTQPASGRNPFRRKDSFRRDDALPGVVAFSDGTQVPGGVYTTRDKPWVVWETRWDGPSNSWVPVQKRWRRIPFINVLSMTTIVVEEKIEQEWRWKGMGIPERVYTGREYPTRRLMWKLHLIDGSTVAGEIKGQPLWIEGRHKILGPFVLHERSKGKMGQTLEDLVYIKKIIVSRRMMDKVLDDLESRAPKKRPEPTSREAPGKG